MTQANRKPTGFVIYRGPSLIDGAPIVAIALTGSSNRKTGNMVQTYILADNGNRPTENVRTGADASICGDCKHRPSTGGACYVVVAQGPTVVWKTLQAGKYPEVNPADIATLGSGRMVRLGTYGDPAAVPAHIWNALVLHAAGRTGYTHQWQNPAIPADQQMSMRFLCMASADSLEERLLARSMGWRTFRVMTPNESPERGEFACPASEEAGKRTTCAKCGACDGAQRGTAQASPAIIAHGGKARRFIAIRAGV